MIKKPKIIIVGGGLAGSEAAWQAVSAGYQVELYEMRPKVMTPAHSSGLLGELVCSNSLKSENPASAPGVLKEEMSALDSLILKAAEKARVPAGQALAVDREVFSRSIDEQLMASPNFKRLDEEVTAIPSEEELIRRCELWIIATGPLTSDGMAKALVSLTEGQERLFFFDAIAPVIATDSIDEEYCFAASRYDKGGSDYLNIPLEKEEYYAFVDAIQKAEKMPLHQFEKTPYFEACLPIEVMIERGVDTLRFGPMKPVGLTNPKTGRYPYAAIQLRQENLDKTMYSMVGFQTKMKWPEQKRIFSMLPALKNAEFLRFGSIHRNTYLKSPEVLNGDLSFKNNNCVFLAGQVSGVEGYTESAAMGILAGRFAVMKAEQKAFTPPPRGTMIGALLHYVTKGGLGDFQPMNANLGLLPSILKQKGISKVERQSKQCNLARESFKSFQSQMI